MSRCVSRITRRATATSRATLEPPKASARQGWPLVHWPRPGKTRPESRTGRHGPRPAPCASRRGQGEGAQRQGPVAEALVDALHPVRPSARPGRRTGGRSARWWARRAPRAGPRRVGTRPSVERQEPLVHPGAEAAAQGSGGSPSSPRRRCRLWTMPPLPKSSTPSSRRGRAPLPWPGAAPACGARAADRDDRHVGRGEEQAQRDPDAVVPAPLRVENRVETGPGESPRDLAGEVGGAGRGVAQVVERGRKP